jgi:integrase
MAQPSGRTKEGESEGTVPVIAQLKLFLDQHRASSGNPTQGFIFRNLLGNPLNLDLLVTEVLRPALEAEKIPWYGWHAFRHGLATNLHRLGVSDKVIQQILRHANVTTTINIYVENGHTGRGRSDEEVGVEVFPSCSPNCSPTTV